MYARKAGGKTKYSLTIFCNKNSENYSDKEFSYYLKAFFCILASKIDLFPLVPDDKTFTDKGSLTFNISVNILTKATTRKNLKNLLKCFHIAICFL